MNCYPALLKYGVVCLACLHALAGRHVFCCEHTHKIETGSAHAAGTFFVVCYAHHSPPCDRSHHHGTDESQDSIGCGQNDCCGQNNPCNHAHECNESAALQIVSTQRDVDEWAKLFSALLTFFVDSPPPVAAGFRESGLIASSALPLRLHLFYGLLLI